jgi:hypothetical protein
MPPDLHIGQSANLLQGFLDLVLSEVALAGRRGGPDVLGAERLGNGDQPDIAGLAPTPARCLGDPVANGAEIGGNRDVE